MPILQLDQYHLKRFLGEVHHQGLLVQMALDDLNLHFEHWSADPTSMNNTRVWYSLSGALNAMTSIANVFWPTISETSKGRPNPRGVAAQTRARELRALLELPDSGLTSVRAIRNALVHFDENMDQVGDANLIDRLIGPAGLIGGDDFLIARHIDPASSQISVFGRQLPFQEAVSESAELVHAVLAVRNHWGRPLVS